MLLKTNLAIADISAMMFHLPAVSKSLMLAARPLPIDICMTQNCFLGSVAKTSGSLVEVDIAWLTLGATTASAHRPLCKA